MPSLLKVNMRELVAFAKLEQSQAKELMEDMKGAVTTATIETHHRVVQKEPVYKGQLRNSTHFKAPILTGRGVIKTVSGEIFLVGNAALYGNVQDLGRTPGKKMPPHATLRRWVELQVSRGNWKLDPRRNKRAALNQAAFLVRRKISKRPAVKSDGTKKGLEFFKQAEDFGLARLSQLTHEIVDKFVEGLER